MLFDADGYSTESDEDRPADEARTEAADGLGGTDTADVGASLDSWVAGASAEASAPAAPEEDDGASSGPRYARVGGEQISTQAMGSSDKGTLHLIGLGLGDETDISLKGLAIVKRCARVFLESYTSILGVDHAKLEALCGRTVTLAGRDMVESESGSGAIDPISIEQRRLIGRLGSESNQRRTAGRPWRCRLRGGLDAR